MANGQKQIATASIQPGTSNQPYPVGELPPFVPVDFIVVDQNAEAIIGQLTPQVVALFESLALQIGNPNVPETMLASLAEINDNLTRIADIRSGTIKSTNDLTISILSYTDALNKGTQLMSAQVANQVQFNNYYKAFSNEIPEMPSFKKQVEDSIKGAIELNSAARRANFVNDTINDTITETKNWITGTEAYQTVSNYLKSVKDSILAVLPPSIKTIVTNTKTGNLTE